MAEAAPDPFAALGDVHRRSIVGLLASGELSVVEIAESLPISRPAVSRHLRLLKEAGLVQDRADGNRRLYRLDDGGADTARAFLQEIWGEATARYKLTVENTRQHGSTGR